ncbi:MAG: TIM barrel protein [Candidatus Diapherotrites archaeon]|nr:TIM barrel protein [Candidatus Diapherotrites archaeon]
MAKAERLLFGTAGIPISAREPSTAGGIKRVRELGLDAMELEFVHSVNLSEAKAKDAKRISEEENVRLTCHGQYFINLNAVEREKIEASAKRIANAAKIANFAGASSITFHAGFYLKDSPEKTYSNIKEQLGLILADLKNSGNKIVLRPETTGRASQFGSLEELLSLSSEIGGVLPCIDFSHLHARSGGKINSEGEFRQVLEKSEKFLGKNFLGNLHCHVSGIDYSAKGERRHLLLDESDFKYKALLLALKEFDCRGIIICESPNLEGDALLLKKTFEKI